MFPSHDLESALVGFVISQNTVTNSYHDYIYTTQQNYDLLREDLDDDLRSVEHASGEYNMDSTTGDSLGLSGNFLSALNYGLNPFSFSTTDNPYESWIIITFGIFKSLLIAYTGMLLFMILKNKKNN